MILRGRDVCGKARETAAEGIGAADSVVTLSGRLCRIGLLMTLASLLLGWLVAHTDVLFADGLRYIRQAEALTRGVGDVGLKKAVDHPAYPVAVAVAHRIIGGQEPDDWQSAAQLASVVAGVLLVIPLYLVSRDLFGDSAAVPACLLFYVAPLTGHVFADTLSESTFLFFWMCGLWASLRFLKGGAFGWVPAVVGFSALAYLTRPEGLLLPAALLTTLGASPVWVARGLGKRGLLVLGVLVVGSACLVGPYVAFKGGIGTKPSVGRLLGLRPKSPAHAVERQRPLDPDQSAAKTYAVAGKAVVKATAEALTWPLIPLAAIGLVCLRPRGGEARQWRLLAVIGAASVLALVRLHATGGYCSPRHTLILSVILIPAAAFGLERLLVRAAETFAARPPWKTVGWVLALAAAAIVNAPETFAPVNEGMDGYKQAGRWLSAHTPEGVRVVDVTGWTQFYGRRAGYTFEDLVAAPDDRSARWVVVREAHLRGPWDYCQRLRDLVDGLDPVAVFPGSARHRPTKVYLFDRLPRLARSQPDAPPARR